MKRSLVFGWGLAAALGGAAVQAAPVIWDNGAVASLLPGGSNLSGFHQAANFSTSYLSNLTGLTFWSLEAANAYSGSISYSIWGDQGGTPDTGTLLSSGSVAPTRTAEVGDVFGLNIFRNDFSFSLLNLAAGNYWLGLHLGDLSSGSDAIDFYWSWADANTTNGGASDDQEQSLFPYDPTWGTNQAEHAFLINGERVGTPVPAPASLALSLLALSLLGTSAPRRQIKPSTDA